MIEKTKPSLKMGGICFLFLLVIVSNTFGITPKQEKDLAHEFLKVALKNLKIVEDPLVVSYVEHVGRKLLVAAGPQQFKFKFYVVEEDEYNAFAGPAGNIFINTGLLCALENEDELAGILAHEIAHATCRHISDMIERSKKTQVATLAGIVAGIFLGAGGATQAAGAVAISSVAAGASLQLAYSRENESQADQLGLNYLQKAGYSGWGLIDSLKIIRSKTWFGSEQIPTYLKTHPASEERIVSLGTWLEQQEPRKDLKRTPDYAFERFHAKLTATYTDAELAQKRYHDLVEKDADNPMYHYGYGLALARNGNRKEAIQHLKLALAKKAFDAYLLMDLGQIYFQDGQYEEALNIMKNLAAGEPYNVTANYYLGRILKEMGRFDEAIDVLEQVLQKDPKHIEARYFLGEIYGKQGKLADAHYHLGIYYRSKGELHTAVFHLKRALKEIKDAKKKEKITRELQKISNEDAHYDQSDQSHRKPVGLRMGRLCYEQSK